MCEVETTNDHWVHALDIYIYIYIYILFVLLAIDKDSGNYPISSKLVLIVLV